MLGKYRDTKSQLKAAAPTNVKKPLGQLDNINPADVLANNGQYHPILSKTTDTGNRVVLSTNTAKVQRENPLAEIFGYMTTGQIPRNEHLMHTLSETKQVLENERLNSKFLDSQGRTIAKDFEKYIEVIERLIIEKNSDEIIQDVLKDTGSVVGLGATTIGTLPVGEFYGSFRQMIVTLIRSGEIRDISMDFLALFKSVLGTKVTFAQRPVIQTTATSATSGSPMTEVTIEAIPKPQGTTQEFEITIKPPSSFKQSAVPVATSVPASKYQYAAASGIPPPLESRMREEDPNYARWRNTYRERGYQTGLQAVDYSKRTSFWDYQYYDKLSTLQAADRDLVENFVVILTRFAARDEYKVFVNSIFNVVDAMRQQSLETDVTGEAWSNSKDLFDKSMLLLSRFCGERELSDFKLVFGYIWNQIGQDQQMLNWFADLRSFVLASLNEINLLRSDIKMRLAEDLIARGILFVRDERYQRSFYDLYDISSAMLHNVQSDPVVTDFQTRSVRLGKDLFFGSSNSPDLLSMQGSFSQLQYLMFPLFTKWMQNIPIDRIEVFGPKLDLRIDDLVFSGTEILPDYFDFKLDNNMHLDVHDIGKGTTQNYLKVKMSHIMPSFQRLRFWYHKKSFPKIEDYGVADFALIGSGAQIKIKWLVEKMVSQVPVISLDKVKCKIDKMKINIIGKETKHRFLDAMVIATMKGHIRNKMQQAIEQSLFNNLQGFNDRINIFLNRRRGGNRFVNRANIILNRAWTQGARRIKKSKKKVVQQPRSEILNATVPSTAFVPSTISSTVPSTVSYSVPSTVSSTVPSYVSYTIPSTVGTSVAPSVGTSVAPSVGTSVLPSFNIKSPYDKTEVAESIYQTTTTTTTTSTPQSIHA